MHTPLGTPVLPDVKLIVNEALGGAPADCEPSGAEVHDEIGRIKISLSEKLMDLVLSLPTRLVSPTGTMFSLLRYANRTFNSHF